MNGNKVRRRFHQKEKEQTHNNVRGGRYHQDIKSESDKRLDEEKRNSKKGRIRSNAELTDIMKPDIINNKIRFSSWIQNRKENLR